MSLSIKNISVCILVKDPVLSIAHVGNILNIIHEFNLPPLNPFELS
jgi:hypothetical protein